MTHSTAAKSERARHLPNPIVKKMRWPLPVIWLIPILAAALAGYYGYERIEDRGPVITLKFTDASGLKDGQSHIVHLGVTIGDVVDTQLSPDKKQAMVRVQLKRSEATFAQKGAQFWIVRPEISSQEISGLATILSGPFIDATPGYGEIQTEFIGLETPPATVEDGLRIVLKTSQSQRMQSNAPVYFRGIQVGTIEAIGLSSDATNVDVHIFIRQRFAPLVKSNSQFWVVSGVDVKGGLLSGIQMKVESLRSLLAGGIGFATPEQNMGEQAKNGSEFVLHDDPKKEWLEWSPKIPIGPDDSATGHDAPSLPQPPQAIRSAVGS